LKFQPFEMFKWTPLLINANLNEDFDYR
jgi:hypothetical protein